MYIADNTEDIKLKKRVDPFSVLDNEAEAKGKFELKEEICLKGSEEVKESAEASGYAEPEIAEFKKAPNMKENDIPSDRIEYEEKVPVRSGCMPGFGCGDRSLPDKAISFDQFYGVMVKKIGEERVYAGDVVFESSIEFN